MDNSGTGFPKTDSVFIGNRFQEIENLFVGIFRNRKIGFAFLLCEN